MCTILLVVSETLLPTSNAKQNKKNKSTARMHYLQNFLVIWEQTKREEREREEKWKYKSSSHLKAQNKHTEIQGATAQGGLKVSPEEQHGIFLQCIQDAQRNWAAASRKRVPNHDMHGWKARNI